MRYLHHPTTFNDAMHLRIYLIDVLEELVPNNMSFSLGYYEGQQHSKIWLSSKEDFKAMYSRYPKGEIMLWCDGRAAENEEDEQSRRKRKKFEAGRVTKRDEKELDMEDMAKVLKESKEARSELMLQLLQS